MSYRVTLIEGDGIGPEVTAAMVRILDAAGAPIQWERVLAGAGAVEQFGTTLPEEALASIRRNRVGIKGPLATPSGGGYSSANVALRKALDLYVCLRPVLSVPGIVTPYKDIDLVVLRENTEGLYSGIEHEVVPGVIVSINTQSRAAGLRIARWAAEYARNNGRRRLTVCHKAHILKKSDGCFLETVAEVAEDYPFLHFDDEVVDGVARDLGMDPVGAGYDVLLLQNLNGDVISDLCAGLVGGLGVVPGANIGDRYAVFEAVHGTAPDIAGKGMANPLAILMSALLMLDYMGERGMAEQIRSAVHRVLEAGEVRTRDLGGTANTDEFTRAIIGALQR